MLSKSNQHQKSRCVGPCALSWRRRPPSRLSSAFHVTSRFGTALDASAPSHSRADFLFSCPFRSILQTPLRTSKVPNTLRLTLSLLTFTPVQGTYRLRFRDHTDCNRVAVYPKNLRLRFRDHTELQFKQVTGPLPGG
jgi:hypothetical protein